MINIYQHDNDPLNVYPTHQTMDIRWNSHGGKSGCRRATKPRSRGRLFMEASQKAGALWTCNKDWHGVTTIQSSVRMKPPQFQNLYNLIT